MPTTQNLSLAAINAGMITESAFHSDAVRKVGLGNSVARSIANLPQTATEALFTIAGGRVLIPLIFGEITTAVQAQATTVKLQGNPTAAGTSVDLCATVDVNAATVATLLSITGTFATAMQKGLAVISQTTPIILQIGTIDAVTGASSTGAWKWTCLWIPLDAGATLVAA